jgi:hypothetical protein
MTFHGLAVLPNVAGKYVRSWSTITEKLAIAKTIFASE